MSVPVDAMHHLHDGASVVSAYSSNVRPVGRWGKRGGGRRGLVRGADLRLRFFPFRLGDPDNEGTDFFCSMFRTSFQESKASDREGVCGTI